MNAPPPTPEQTLEDDEDEEEEEEEEKGYSRERERERERGGNPCVTLGRESRPAAQKRGGEFRREKYLRGF